MEERTAPTRPLAVASASPSTPTFDGDLARAWVARNYSDESKRLVTEGAEATPEDQAKYSRAYAAGLFSRATTAALTVAPGTAEQLARIAHFRALEDTQPEELDYLALWLLGAGLDSPTKWALWERIRPLGEHLWSFVTDDWDEDDCDPMTVQEVDLPAGHGWDACAQRTRERLIGEIEQAVWLARYRAVEVTRTAAAS